jgi:hypothetical protein
MICLLFADSCRSVVSDLATDVIVHVGEVRFCLHKVSFLVFPVILLKLTLKIVFALEIMITGSRNRHLSDIHYTLCSSSDMECLTVGVSLPNHQQ